MISSFKSAEELDGFRKNFFGKNVFYKKSSEDYEEFLNYEDLESYLFCSRIWQNDPVEGPGIFISKYPEHSLSIPKISEIGNITSLISNGFSLYLTKLQKSHYKINKVCNLFSRYLELVVGADIFISPKNSQGFSSHFDQHDVLIVQLKGSKQWNVSHTSKVENVMFEEEYRNEISAKSEYNFSPTCYQLDEGDLLYIPRGYEHEVRSLDSASMHLTLSFYPVTEYQYLEAKSQNHGIYKI